MEPPLLERARDTPTAARVCPKYKLAQGRSWGAAFRPLHRAHFLARVFFAIPTPNRDTTPKRRKRRAPPTGGAATLNTYCPKDQPQHSECAKAVK